jgi:hypothetical protein
MSVNIILGAIAILIVLTIIYLMATDNRLPKSKPFSDKHKQ